MFNFKQFLAGAAATIVVLGVTAPAIADSRDDLQTFDTDEILVANSFNDSFKKERGELLDTLNLSASQKQQIKAIHDRYNPQMSDLRSQIRVANAAMKELAQSNASRSRLETQYRTNRSLMDQFADLKFQQMLDIREVLTVAQRRDMAEFIDQKKKERGGDFFGN